MSITIHELAAIAGLNPSTVSRAMHGDSCVKAATRERITALAAKYGYSGNWNARHLALGNTRMIALAVASMQSEHAARAADAISAALEGTGYTLMILVHRNDPLQIQACTMAFAQHICDGAVLYSPSQVFLQTPGYALIRKSGFPMICLDQWFEDESVPAVSNDADYSIRLLTDSLLKEGMNLACLCMDGRNTVNRFRKKAAEKYLKKNRIPFFTEMDQLANLIRGKKKVRLGIYADSMNFQQNLPDDFFPKHSLGAMFDSWKYKIPNYFDKVFLCTQDTENESRYAVQNLLKAIQGKKHSEKIVFFPPTGIIVV